MIYYRCPESKEVYAYDQKQVDSGWVKENTVKMSPEEVYLHLHPLPTVQGERSKRDGKLAQLDNIVSNPLRFSGFSDLLKDQLAEYRQLLLDVPQQPSFPTEIVWPPIPTILNSEQVSA